jgi:oxygen-independent coproporphyrinogen-3 oxidase
LDTPAQDVRFDAELIRRYDTAGPRYTSYPTALQFAEGFAPARYAEIARASNASGRPLSLYFHIPFCDTVCFYCACNKVATKDHGRAVDYLARLHREIELQGALFDRARPVEQLHWGGGTPTFLSHDEMRALMAHTARHFSLREDDGGQYSIEIDPRQADKATIALLRRLGFNRMSLGVQDLDERVQRAVNRHQSEAETLAVLEAARAEGFRSVSLDLIYGLPYQTPESFALGVERIIEMSPDRISLFNYAHLPQLFKPQRRIDEKLIPPSVVKLEILRDTIAALVEAGYVFIGMDHFARPDDELAKAQREGTLYRNFQGYSTHADCDLVALGTTAIGMVGDSYTQNVKDLDAYYARIDADELPVYRGVELDSDDRVRRRIITEIICHFRLDFASVERAYGIEFARYFEPELEALRQMQADGLIELDAQGLQVLPRGRLLVRNVCMVFDRYLQSPGEQRYSKVI